MSSAIKVVANDAGPDLVILLVDEETSRPVNLEGDDRLVYAKFRKRGAATTLFTSSCTKVDALAGIVSMTWPTGGLVRTQGWYEIEVYVSTAGVIQTVYDRKPVYIKEDFA